MSTLFKVSTSRIAAFNSLIPKVLFPRILISRVLTALAVIPLVAIPFMAVPLALFARYTPSTITPNKIPAAYYDPYPADPSSYYDPRNPNPSKKNSGNDTEAILFLIEGQINAIQSGNYNSAYNDYTSGAFRNQTSFDEFKYFITSYPIFTKTKNAYFGGVDIRGSNAMLQGALSAADGETSKVDFYLVKEGENWKILGMSLNQSSPFPKTQEKAAKAYDFQQDIQ